MTSIPTLLRCKILIILVMLISSCGGENGSPITTPPQPPTPVTPTPVTPTPVTPTPVTPTPVTPTPVTPTPVTPTYQITGAGIKGPLKHAKVSLINFDPTLPSGIGEIISVGVTNEFAQITDLEVTIIPNNYYILSFESNVDTIDLSTQMPPIISKFETIVSSTDIISGKAIYASPLSSLGLAILQSKLSDGTTTDIEVAINDANTLIKSIFSYGVSEDIDIFNSPSMFIANADSFEKQIPILELRKSIEVFSIMAFQIQQDLNDPEINIQDIFNNIASDILDGELDAKIFDNNELYYGDAQLNIFKQTVNNIVIPNRENITLASLKTLLVEESSLLHNVVLNTEKLLSSSHFIGQPFIALNVDYDDDGILNAEDIDDDGDSVMDINDSFPYNFHESHDTDNDGIGNNTDLDDDNDGVIDEDDVFPLDKLEFSDFDNDGIGDNTDDDDDGDNVKDINDTFPYNADESTDTDNDGIGNNADNDDDNDQVLDADDSFPLDNNEWLDFDNDGLGNNRDFDDDNDGIYDNEDKFPFNENESSDTDNDGVGNNADTDDDGDGVADGLDDFPLDASEQVDTDIDGIGNNADNDDDNDGEPDLSDFFPLDPTEKSDNDSDGLGDNKDTDDDNDGVQDVDDIFPFDKTESIDTDSDGIGNNADTDDDNDNVLDVDDTYPLDSNEWIDTDEDGIGNNADNDDDNDGVFDNDDDLPLDPTESRDFDKDLIGDIADIDDDNDGLTDDNDYLHITVNQGNTFDPEELIIVNLRGFFTNGTRLNANDGWSIQYEVIDVNLGKEVPFYAENFYYNANFSGQKQEWIARLPAPSYSGEFEVKFTLYCGGYDFCGEDNLTESIYWTEKQSIIFKVNCLSEPCGYQADIEPGRNVSASKVANYLTTSVVKENGDIIAIYRDEAENLVVKSTNNGYSWSRIARLPTTIMSGSLIEHSNGPLILAGACGSRICLHTSTDGTIWIKKSIDTVANIENCMLEACNGLQVRELVETEDSALMIVFDKTVNEIQTSYTTKSYDEINWSNPTNIFGNEFSTAVFSLIKTDNSGFAAAVYSSGNIKVNIYFSEDGETWSLIDSYDFINAADLKYHNGTLRFFYQEMGTEIFERNSTDFATFSAPVKVIDKSYSGFNALYLNSGNFGILHNLFLNYQYDIFYQDVDLSN